MVPGAVERGHLVKQYLLFMQLKLNRGIVHLVQLKFMQNTIEK